MLFNFIWHLQVIFASKHSTLIPWVHIEFNNMNFHSEESIIYVWQKPSSWRINSYQIPKGNKFSLCSSLASCQASNLHFQNSVYYPRFRNESTGNSLAHPCPTISIKHLQVTNYHWDRKNISKYRLQIIKNIQNEPQTISYFICLNRCDRNHSKFTN